MIEINGWKVEGTRGALIAFALLVTTGLLVLSGVWFWAGVFARVFL